MPSILSTRQAYQWINRIAQKHKRLASLKITEGQHQKHWLDMQFVRALVALEGVGVSDTDLTAALSPTRTVPTANPALAETFKAVQLLQAVVETHKQNARLDMELLLRLNAPDGGGAFRQTPLVGSSVRPENLPLMVEQVCRWFASSSIGELNPIEQAALAFLRFAELAPFATHNERTALLAASLFTLRQGLPPIILQPESKAAYRAALKEGLQMNTQPMVELVASAIEQTLDAMLNESA